MLEIPTIIKALQNYPIEEGMITKEIAIALGLNQTPTKIKGLRKALKLRYYLKKSNG